MTLYRFFRSINYVLFALIVGVSLYLMLLPILPEIFFRLSSFSNNSAPEPQVVLESRVISPVEVTGRLPAAEERTEGGESQVDENMEEQVQAVRPPQMQIDSLGLSIPSIRLNDAEVISSFDSDDLWRGIWHKKRSGDPVDGGNMVITAHRFLYTGYQDTFYHLPKAQPGEEIVVTWGGEEYVYEVTDTFVVTPDQVDIEAPTDEHILTLYTCTPLWTSQRRHVVRAVPKF